ncbi:MAG: hypothetical protein AB1650_04135 [Candidatus Omnitrophota bacterium]
MNNLPAKKNIDPYQQLINSLHMTWAEGLAAAQRALEYHRVKTYWNFGIQLKFYIDEHHILTNVKFYKKLSKKMKEQKGDHISYDTLRRTVQFSREYPVFPENTPLTFTHYLNLLRVHDPRARQRLELLAIKKSMTVEQLQQEINSLCLVEQPLVLEKPAQLKFERGEPYVYAIKNMKDINGKRIYRVDCGFKIHKNISSKNASYEKGGSIVRFVKTGETYSSYMCGKLRDKRYTYSAIVKKVVDGDTFDATVDVGFGIWIEDRFRLKGINCEEMKSGGAAAKAFLNKKFRECPSIVIRTFKEGMYGRWLADVFLMKGESDPRVIAKEGEYLNQVMLDKGLAEVYGG